jgi:hypothetical protein
MALIRIAPRRDNQLDKISWTELARMLNNNMIKMTLTTNDKISIKQVVYKTNYIIP